MGTVTADRMEIITKFVNVKNIAD